MWVLALCSEVALHATGLCDNANVSLSYHTDGYIMSCKRCQCCEYGYV